ncbi:MAG TPA: hypothetical protein VF534_13830 [Paraburkholderia sp.]
MIYVAYTGIAAAVAAVLGTRRIGLGNWQAWAIYGIVGLSAAIGRLS